jgi:Recombination endonuclease VII
MSTHRRKYPRPVITPAERAALEALQGDCCAICRRDDVELFADHSHRTGRTRGLLCRTCNTGLGQLKDSIKRLRAALHYLLRPPARLLEA